MGSYKNTQFTVLSEYYDRLNGADHKRYAEFVKEIFNKHGSGKEELVLDLACGTGALTTELSALGYDMIGADISPDMLMIASGKAIGEGKNILYICQDMRDFELYGTVSAVVSALDGINYLTKKEDVIKCFKNVRNYLDPGGLFIFDINSPYRFGEVLAKRDYFLEGDGVYLGWKTAYHPIKGICQFYLTLFIEDEDGAYVKREEVQTEKIWHRADIEEMLTEAGMELVTVYSDFDMTPAKENDEKWYFVCRCPFDK